MNPIRNGNVGHTRMITRCCGIEPVTVGSYGSFYKTCPNCGRGDIYRDVAQEHEYVPSAAERELHKRIRQLEETVERLEMKETEPLAAILLHTIAAEAERTGSWHVPADLQERLKAWVAERDGGAV